MKRLWFKKLGSEDGLLDNYPATALWSLDNIWYTAYSGAVIEVYNGVTYEDFLPEEIIDGTLATFLNGADGLVSTQYDVTGNGNHQTTTSGLTTDMYLIAVAGVVNVDGNGKPFIFIPTTVASGFHALGTFGNEIGIYMAFRAQTDYAPAMTIVGGGNKYFGRTLKDSTNSSVGAGLGSGTNSQGLYWSNGVAVGANPQLPTQGELWTAYYDQIEHLGKFKADELVNWPFIQILNYNAAGDSYFSRPMEYKICLLFSDGNYVSADQSAIETIINNFYSIY